MVPLNVTLGANFRVNGTRLSGSLNYVGVKVGEVNTYFGNFTVLPEQVHDVAGYIINSILLPIVNLIISPGMELPLFEGAVLKTPSVAFGNHFLSITSNIDLTTRK